MAGAFVFDAYGTLFDAHSAHCGAAATRCPRSH
jgi:FMN phosphatase YigB (HAD superfamily)